MPDIPRHDTHGATQETDRPVPAVAPDGPTAGNGPTRANRLTAFPPYAGLYEKLVNSLGGIVWEADGSTFQFTFVSPQAEQILGYPVQQWLDEPAFWRDHTHPEDVGWCVEFCLKATARREDHEFKYRMIAADGRIVWLQDVVTVTVEAGGAVRLRGIMMDITERKLADERLSLSESQFRTTFEKSGSGMALVDMRGYATTCNPALLDLLGYSQAEMASRPFCEFTLDDDRPVDIELYQELVDGKRDRYEIEKRFVTKRGEVIWGNLVVTLIKDQQGKPVYAVDMLQDVTERKRASVELHRVSERLQLATKAAGIGIWDWDVINDVLVWDDAMYRLFGTRREKFSGAYSAWMNILVPEDRAWAESEVQAALRGERDLSVEFRVVWPNDSIRFIRAVAQVFRDENGRAMRMVGVNYDVTERRQAEEKLRWNEEQLRLLLDSTGEGIFGVDLLGRCIFCNVTGQRLLGYSDLVQLIGREMHSQVAHSYSDGRNYPHSECPAVRSLQTATQTFNDKDVFWRRDGTNFPVEYWSYPMRRAGKHVGAVVTFRDVTERRQAEKSLRLSEDRFAKAFRSSPEPISIFRDRDGVLLEVNERWTTVYGYTREEAVGHTSLELGMINEPSRQLLRDGLDRDGTLREIAIQLVTKRGNVREVGITSEQITIGDELCNIFLHHDVTERRRAEEDNRKLIHDLGERVKELTALHLSARILQDESKPESAWLREIVTLLPPSWQYPEITASRVTFGDLDFATDNYRPTPWMQTAEFVAAGRSGSIQIAYLEERPPEAIGPFLREELHLLESLAELISSALDRRYSQEALLESEERLQTSHDQLRALSASLRSAKEEEGIRIARELHDELGSALTSLKWGLLNLDRRGTGDLLRSTQAVLTEKIAEMVALVDSTINTVRRISSELRPSVLDDLGLISALEWHAHQFEIKTGIICRFEANVEQVDLPRGQATAIFRIFQEATTNVMRHAAASKVNVLIECDEGEFVLEIRDNGRGVTESEGLGATSLGLLGMRERAHAIGAELSIKGIPEQGTTVVMRLPLEDQQDSGSLGIGGCDQFDE